jgi:hypothetical protein
MSSERFHEYTSLLSPISSHLLDLPVHHEIYRQEGELLAAGTYDRSGDDFSEVDNLAAGKT